MKILFALSGSGGHIFPALACARSIIAKYSQAQIVFLTETNRVSTQLLGKSEFEVFFLDTLFARRIHLQSPASIIKLLITFMKSLRTLREIRPDVIVGFGGYVSIVPILLAKFFKAKSIIHEQNVILGRANHFLSLFSDLIAVSFSQTRHSLKNPKLLKKIIYTGLPLREDLKSLDSSLAARFFDFDPNIFTILLLGGSQGSHSINKYFLNCLRELPLKDKLQIIHICGFKDEPEIRSSYVRHSNLAVRIFSFLNEMSSAFSAADLCICRSGASTIAELTLFRLPAILIPYPGAHVHQRENAKILTAVGGALLIEQRDLELFLKEKLEYLFYNRKAIKDMKESFPKTIAFNASDRLRKAIINIR